MNGGRIDWTVSDIIQTIQKLQVEKDNMLEDKKLMEERIERLEQTWRKPGVNQTLSKLKKFFSDSDGDFAKLIATIENLNDRLTSVRRSAERMEEIQ